MRFAVMEGGRAETVEVTGGAGRFRVTLGDQVWEVDARAIGHGLYSLIVDGVSHAVDVSRENGSVTVSVAGERYLLQVEEETRHAIRTRGLAAGATAGQTLKAPLPGKVSQVAVRPGDPVKPGDTLLVIEAMKMENECKAQAAGTVAEVRVEVGQAVNAGDVLVVID